MKAEIRIQDVIPEETHLFGLSDRYFQVLNSQRILRPNVDITIL